MIEQADFLDAFRKGVKELRRQSKSDDILQFMRKNWNMFAASRQAFEMVWRELEGRSDLSVTALCEALGVDERVVFKRVKAVDTAATILHPQTSALYKLFCEQRNKMFQRGLHMLCLVAVGGVSGEHSLIITDMPAWEVPNKVHMYLLDEDGKRKIHFIPVQDARERLSGLFKHED